MKLSNIEEKVLPNFKGGEIALKTKIFSDDLNKILTKAVLVPHATVGKHTHDTSSEIIYIISGDAKAICDGVEEILHPGDVHYCKKGSTHELHNLNEDTDLVFFAVVPEQ